MHGWLAAELHSLDNVELREETTPLLKRSLNVRIRPDSRKTVWQQAALRDSTSEKAAMDIGFDEFLNTACKVVRDQTDTTV